MNKFSLGEVNRFVLHKQHLTADSPGDDVAQVVKDICALHAQVPTTPYLSLLHRLKNFNPADLEQILYQSKSLVKVKCMRGTLFLLPRELVVPAVVATRKQFAGRGGLLKQYAIACRIAEEAKRDPAPFKVSEEDLDRLTEEILDLIKEAGAGLRVEEIKRQLGTPIHISYLISSLCDRGILARAKTDKWTTAKHRYVLWDHWLPDLKLAMDRARAETILVSKYLAAFGPVTENDIAWWTGLSKTAVRRVLKKMEPETEKIEVEGLDGSFFLLKSELADLASISSTDNAVHLLPRFDAYVVGYKDRRRLIAQEHQERVFWKTRGEIAASILANGGLVGTWTHKKERDKLTITFSLFEAVSNGTVEKIYAEAERVGEFIGGKEIKVDRRVR